MEQKLRVSRSLSLLWSGILCLVMMGMLTQCNNPQQDLRTQQQVQQGIASACGDVNAAMSLAAPFAAVPQVGAVMLYGAAACGTAQAVSALTTKAMSDPATQAWTQGLAQQIKASVR